MKILLVDQNQQVRDLVRDMLFCQQQSCRLTETFNLEDSFQAIEKEHYDVVLLDYPQQPKDGISYLKALKSHPKAGSTPIVTMHREQNDELALECIQAGAQDVIFRQELTSSRLNRAVFQAKKRIELEQKFKQRYTHAQQMAKTDPLTGLVNRCYFEALLEEKMTSCRNDSNQLALFLINIDHLKSINHMYGRDYGDALLKSVVEKINICLPECALFARNGGDEFAIVLVQKQVKQAANLLAGAVINMFESPCVVNGQPLQTSVSIGIALQPDNANDAKQLIGFANIAMYQAKELGRDQFCYFRDLMHQQFSRTLQIAKELKRASKANDFELVYQPVIAGQEQKLVGFEALIRWPSCSYECYPDEFIPLAERSNLINEIGGWVISTAISQLASWQKSATSRLTMAVNVSAMQLAKDDLVSLIETTLAEYELNPNQLVVEITETALISSNEQTSRTIHQLHRLGCQLALDDFGTGFSSLSHLLNYPIDIVKLDKSMLPASAAKSKHMSMVRGIAALTQKVNLKVIAEGVENSFHYLFCKELNIAEFQGYFFGRPQPAEETQMRWLPNPSAQLTAS